MGEEARIAMIEEQAQRDLLGFLNNPCTERLSYYKGRSFIYKMNNQNDQRAHILEQMRAAGNFVT